MQQRTTLQRGVCRNHEGRQAIYFLSEQPWIKFCPECALNVALFGKKISKDLTAEQQKSKAKVNSWLSQMNNTLDQIGTSRKKIDNFIIDFENSLMKVFSGYIKQVEQHVQQICELSKEIKHIYNQFLESKVSQFHQRQTAILLHEMSLKNEIQQIESKAQSIVEGKSEKSLQQKIQEWDRLIKQSNDLMIKEEQISTFHEFAQRNLITIKSKIIQIMNKKLILESLYDVRTQQKQNNQKLVESDLIPDRRRTKLQLRSQSKNSQCKKDRNQISAVKRSLRDSSSISVLSTLQY